MVLGAIIQNHKSDWGLKNGNLNEQWHFNELF